MENRFICCNRKVPHYVFCANCGATAHINCLKKNETIIHWNGNEILCSDKCLEKYIKTKEINKNYLKEINSLNDTICEKDKVNKELLEEMTKLKWETEEKDSYIEKIKRNSRDFENEAYDAERNYETMMKEYKTQIVALKKVVLNLQKKEEEYLHEMNTNKTMLGKFEENLTVLTVANKNMISTIEVLESERDQHILELISLRKQLSDSKVRKKEDNDLQNRKEVLSNSEKNHQSNQLELSTNSILEADTNNSEEKNSTKVKPDETLQIAQVEKQDSVNIHVIGDESSRNVSSRLNTVLVNRGYKTEGRCQPEADFLAVVEIALKVGTFSGQNDFIIVMFNSKNVIGPASLKKGLRKLCRLSKTTNVVILTQCDTILELNINRLIDREIKKYFAKNNSSLTFLPISNKKRYLNILIYKYIIPLSEIICKPIVLKTVKTTVLQTDQTKTFFRAECRSI